MKIMKLKLWIIGLLSLVALGCQNNSKTTEESKSSAKELKTYAQSSEPGLSLGIASVPNLRDLGGY